MERVEINRKKKTLQRDVSVFGLSGLYCVCFLTCGELNKSVCVNTFMDLRGAACL